MTSYAEMRSRAWIALFERRWLWKIIMVSIFFGAANFAQSLAYTMACDWCGVRTMSDYNFECKMARINKEPPPPPPTREEMPTFVACSALEYFLTFLFAGLTCFGGSRATLDAARDEPDRRTLRRSLVCFAQPFGVAWLAFRIWLQVSLWSLLLIIPGIIAAYRYSCAWQLKCDHPDWSAGKCIAESGRLMAGNKMRAFMFHMSYWAAILVPIVPLVAAVLAIFVGSLALAGVLVLVFLALMTFVGCYMGVGWAVFYDELARPRRLA